MSFRPLHRITVAACVLAVAGLCGAQEGQTQKSEVPAKNKEATPGTAQPQQNGLKNLENDLFKPFKKLAPESSLDAVMTPPSQPVPQARPQDERRLREKRQRDKDWVFMNPEDTKESQSLEEMLNLPTGKDKNSKTEKRLSPVEQYYRRALGLDTREEKNSLTDGDRKKSGRKSLYDTKLPGNLNDGQADEEDDSGLSPGLRETKRSLKAVADDQLKGKENTTWSGKGFFTDIFGLGQSLPTAGEIEVKRAQQENMNEFRKILGVPAVALPATSFDPLAALHPASPSAAPAASLPSVSTATTPSVPNVQIGAIGGLGSAFNAPQNASGVSAFGNTTPQAPVMQPRILMPKAPDFSPPQRRF